MSDLVVLVVGGLSAGVIAGLIAAAVVDKMVVPLQAKTLMIVKELELNTNHRMDELLSRTEEAARLVGQATERQIGAARAAQVAVASAETMAEHVSTQAAEVKKISDETAKLVTETSRVATATEAANEVNKRE